MSANENEVRSVDVGIITAYGYAKTKGFTGTEAEFAEGLAASAQSAANAGASATAAAASELEAQAWAEGKKGSTDVASGAPQYQNNAKYYKGRAEHYAGVAETQAGAASSSASGASASEQNAQAWAEGKKGSTDVASDAPQYQNNAKYHAQNAVAAATLAAGYAESAGQTLASCVTIVTISSTSTTMGTVASQLATINSNAQHVLFDVSALGASMYLCTIFIDTTANVYKIVDIVVGRVAEGTYDSSKLLTMAIAGANAIATQSQIDSLQKQIGELGGSAVFNDWDALGDLIMSGDPSGVIEAGDTVDVNWNKTVLGTTTSGLTVACTDRDKFVTAVGEAEAKDYLFVYNGTAWTYNETAITLSDFGLSVTGTPSTGEVMTITTTVNTINYTFVSKDTVELADGNVPHNWCLERTYVPNTMAYDTYESLFCIQINKTVPAGKYYIPLYSYRSGNTFNLCFELSSALGDTTRKVQLKSNGYSSVNIPNASGSTVSSVLRPSSLTPVYFGTSTTAGSNVSLSVLSDADVAAGEYTLLTSLNTDSADPVVKVGDFDKAALGSNSWGLSNIRTYFNSDTVGASPSHDNDILSSYNTGAGFLFAIDPRVKALIQYANVKWTAGYGNVNTPNYKKASGTAPASDAPIYYSRGGIPGARTYTALDPQPSSGDDVSSYYVLATTYSYNNTYVSEDRVFLLSMREMGFSSINTSEGTGTQLYLSYNNGSYTDSAVAQRAKYNKAGGTKNSYRWSRSAVVWHAYGARGVASSGGVDYNGAYVAHYVAPAFCIGKSTQS